MRCASFVSVSLAGLLWAAGALAQDCPFIDMRVQKKQEADCKALGGDWGRFGAWAYHCNIYSCVLRAKDGGKPCRDHVDCEFLCTTTQAGGIGTEVEGKCATHKNSFGCTTHVNGGRIVGRVCTE